MTIGSNLLEFINELLIWFRAWTILYFEESWQWKMFSDHSEELWLPGVFMISHLNVAP